MGDRTVRFRTWPALIDRSGEVVHDHCEGADAELVIETIIEDLAIKCQEFAKLDQIINKDAIFASNTSSISSRMRSRCACSASAQGNRSRARNGVSGSPGK